MREYRQDSHLYSLGIWMALCVGTAFLVGREGWGPKEGAFLFLLLLFGPLAFFLYLLRARLVWVRIDPGRGIVVSGRETIPWESIEEVEWRLPKLRSTTGPARMGDMNKWVPDLGSGCVVAGIEIGYLAVLFLAIFVVFWLVFFVFIPLLLVPVLEVFAPFGDRIKIRTRRRTWVLRDLNGADEFIRELGQKVRLESK